MVCCDLNFLFTAELAETAETAEDTSAIAQHKDTFFSFSLSGAASRIYVFLSALSELCGEKNHTAIKHH